MSIRYDQVAVGMTLYRKSKRSSARPAPAAYEAVKVLTKNDLACTVVIDGHTRMTLRRDEVQSLYRHVQTPKKPAAAPRATARTARRAH